MPAPGLRSITLLMRRVTAASYWRWLPVIVHVPARLVTRRVNCDVLPSARTNGKRTYAVASPLSALPLNNTIGAWNTAPFMSVDENRAEKSTAAE